MHPGATFGFGCLPPSPPTCPVCKDRLHPMTATILGIGLSLSGLWCRRCRRVVRFEPPKGKKP